MRFLRKMQGRGVDPEAGVRLRSGGPCCGGGMACSCTVPSLARKIPLQRGAWSTRPQPQQCIAEANFDIVWDPPWNPQMITPEGRQRLGID
jgi:hypothetical protein